MDAREHGDADGAASTHALHEVAWCDAPALARGAVLGPWLLLGPMTATDGRFTQWRARRLGDDEEAAPAQDSALGDGEGERRPSSPEPEVALIVPHRWRPGHDLAARMEEAAARARRLVHPHIARLRAVGVTSDGVPWVASQIAEGQSIHLWCHDRSLSVVERQSLFERALEAVQFAHDHGVLHGAIRPSQIIVTPDGRPRWLHFGLEAVLTALEVPPEAPREQLEAPARAYAAPEHRAGARLTQAGEVHALGLVLFELLAGGPPWLAAGPDFQAAAAPQWPRPSEVATHATAKRALRGDLDAIVAKAIEPHVAARYATAAQLLDELRRSAQRRPVWAGTEATRRDTVGRPQRRTLARTAVIIGGLGLMTLGAIAIAFWGIRRSVPQAQPAAAAVASRSGDEPQRALLWQLLQDDGRDQAALLARAETLARGSLKGQPQMLARTLAMIGREHLDEGNLAQGRNLIAEALPKLKDIDDRNDATCDEAWAQARQGDKPTEAEFRLRQIGDSAAVRPITRALCLLRLADLEQRGNRAKLAYQSGRDAWAQFQDSREATPQLGLRIAAAMAPLSVGAGRFHDAQRWLEQALERATALGLDREPQGIALREQWSVLALAAGDAQLSIRLADANLEASGAGGSVGGAGGKPDPATAPPASLYLAAAEPRLELEQWSEARARLEQAIALADARGDRVLRQRAGCLMARVAAREHDAAAAARWMKDAARASDDSDPAQRDAEHLCRVVAAEFALTQGQAADAQRDMERLLTATTPAPLVQAMGSLVRTEALLATGPKDRALNAALQALEQARALHQSDVPDMKAKPSFRSGQAALLLAQAQQGNGDTTEALKTLDYALQQLGATLPPGHSWRRRAEQEKAALAGAANKKP